MSPGLLLRPALALVLAAAPGLVAWGSARSLGPLLQDDALPERLLAHRRRVARVSGASLALIALLTGWQALWAVPLCLLGLLAASFPLRRAVLEESWGFPAYLSHMIRLGAAGLGFLALLAATPALVLAGGPDAAAVLLALLVAWTVFSRSIVLRLARATSLDRPDLGPLFERIIRASGAPAPRVFRAGAAGGRWVNAFALPRLRDSAVLLTDSLLELFTPDEVAAVFAHEVAHLEHFERRRLLRNTVVMALLIGLAVFVVPAFGQWYRGVGGWAAAAWAGVVILATPAALVRHRAHEAESDRRAVALSGDPEALVRALVKLTTLARLPRRWSTEVERTSTHPSLARRIQAIRESAGVAPSALVAPAVLASVETGRFVVLDDRQAHWLDGVPGETPPTPEALRLAARRARSLAYPELVDLHLDVSGASVVLRARSVSGEKWSVPLRPEALAVAQPALDVLDTRLSTRDTPAFGRGVGGLAAALLLLTSTVAGQVLLLLPSSLLALVLPGSVSLGAAGAGALTAGLLLFLRPASPALAPLWAAPTLALAGALALALAVERYRRAAAVRGRGAWLSLGVQATVVLLYGLGLAWSATLARPALRLHQAAAGPAVAASLVGLSAALALGPWRLGRVAAALVLGAGGLGAYVGTTSFAARFVRDPLFVAAPAMPERPLRLEPVAERRLEGPASDLRLSPGGRLWAVRVWSQDEDEDEEAPGRFRLGAFDDAEAGAFAALELRFVDDEHALVLSTTPGGTELRQATASGIREDGWAAALPRMGLPKLAVDPTRRAWRVTGTTPDLRAVRAVQGVAGEPAQAEALFALPEGRGFLPVMGARGGLAIRLRTDEAAMRSRVYPLLFFMSGSYPVESEVWRLTPEGPRALFTSSLQVQCVPPVMDEPFLCLGEDGRQARLFAVDVATGRVEARGIVPGRLVPWEAAAGERLYAWSFESGALILDARTGTRRPLVLGRSPAAVTVFTAGTGVLGVLRPRDAGHVIAVYRAE